MIIANETSRLMAIMIFTLLIVTPASICNSDMKNISYEKSLKCTERSTTSQKWDRNFG